MAAAAALAAAAAAVATVLVGLLPAEAVPAVEVFF